MGFKRLPEGMQAEVVSVGPTANFTAADAPPERISEKEFQARVVAYARRCGWTHYHTYDSHRSQPGFPDLVLVRERVIFAELKAEKGRLSLEQAAWVARLLRAGAEVHVWKPADWAEVVKVLE